MREICIVGGDARMDYAARALQACGYAVTRTNDVLPKQPSVLLLPVKSTADGTHVSGTGVALAEVATCAAQGSVIIGGGLPKTLCGFDYMKNEAFLYDNARLTAEGALVLLGSSTDGELFGADVAVIGMGRIAECLCPLLRAVGARVTVYARRPEVLSRARAMGAQAVRFSGALPASSAQHQIVCNTVPHVLYGRELLASARRDILLMELASAPGGFDMNAIERLGLQYVNGQGLPGKYAPRAAGELIADYVINVLKGERE